MYFFTSNFARSSTKKKHMLLNRPLVVRSVLPLSVAWLGGIPLRNPKKGLLTVIEKFLFEKTRGHPSRSPDFFFDYTPVLFLFTFKAFLDQPHRYTCTRRGIYRSGKTSASIPGNKTSFPLLPNCALLRHQ